MRVTRRTMIMAGGALALGSGAALRATVLRDAVLAIYDSRLPESCTFAAQAKSRGIALLDIAHETVQLWRGVRAAHPHGQVVGLTAWSDLVIVRGVLQDRGRRLTYERQIAGHVFAWAMA